MLQSSATRVLSPPARSASVVAVVLAAALLAGCGPVRVTYEERATWFDMEDLSEGGVVVMVAADDASRELIDQTEAIAGWAMADVLSPGAVITPAQLHPIIADARDADADDPGGGNGVDMAAALRAAAEAFHTHTAYDRRTLAPALPALRLHTSKRFLALLSINDARFYRQYYQSVSHEREVDEWDYDDDEKKHRRRRHRHVTYRTIVTHNWIAGFVADVRLLVIRLDDGAPAWRIYASGTYENRNTDRDFYYGYHIVGPPSPRRYRAIHFPSPPRPRDALFDTVQRLVKRLNDPPAPK